jgi:predicted transcriptional regulator
MDKEKDQVEMLVRLPPSLRERLKQVAKKNKRSANNEAVYAIERHVEQQEKEDPAT